MEKQLYLIRGIPGAGKTSLAYSFGIRAICCADDYITHNGKYIWKPETIAKSHDWCQRKCRKFMKIGVERIFITNTLTTEREMRPYFDLAKNFGYKVFSLIIENRHDSKNVHNVPEETIKKMKMRFDIKL